MPHLKPVRHQSTNWIVRLVLIVATEALTSLGTTSPRYMRQQAMYLPWRGSHLVIMPAGSKTEFVISATDSCSSYASRRDDRRVRREHEVDARVRHEVRLELRDVHVERAVEAERRRERRGHLGEEAVEVRVRRALDVEVAAADVVEGLVVEGERHVRVLEERVRREHRVVGSTTALEICGAGEMQNESLDLRP